MTHLNLLLFDLVQLVLEDNINTAWVQIIKLLQRVGHELHPPDYEILALLLVLNIRQLLPRELVLALTIKLQLVQVLAHQFVQVLFWQIALLLWLKESVLDHIPDILHDFSRLRAALIRVAALTDRPQARQGHLGQ